MFDKSLIIFVKNPELGKAKSRIAAEVGQNEANMIYNNLLSVTNNICKPLQCEKVIYYSDFINRDDNWCNDAFDKKLQVQGDLGFKMFQAISEQLDHSDKVILIGSDCPYITSTIIQKAFNDLDSFDYTFGPTYDGGYYLVGTRINHHGPFVNIPWSTSKVMQTTIDQLDKYEFSYCLQVKLYDIDHYEDWTTYRDTLAKEVRKGLS